MYKATVELKLIQYCPMRIIFKGSPSFKDCPQNYKVRARESSKSLFIAFMSWQILLHILLFIFQVGVSGCGVESAIFHVSCILKINQFIEIIKKKSFIYIYIKTC